MTRWGFPLALVVTVAAVSSSPSTQEPIEYRFSFPQPIERWMQVDATFTELGTAPLELRVSRSSPGRYAEHDFARNVYDLHAYDADGRELRTERPDNSGWTVPSHPGSVAVKYKVYGNQLDGTYLAVDATHAHVNMPAALVWARGLADRPARVTFEPPSGTRWEVATQLYPGSTATEFSAPNLQYLIDSPVEFGPVMVERFNVGPRTFRFFAHHTGTRMELQALVKDVSRIVEQEGAIFGEFPSFETGAYSFLVDLLPYASGDGMEHRNSTVITVPGAIANARIDILDAVSHEFFHAWNVERIRPKSLEPFDLERVNPSGELWLAEGFTQYYGPLAMRRAGLLDDAAMARSLAGVLNAISAAAGRLARSAEATSLMAVTERPNGGLPPGVVSYYPLGAAIALALDLSLRARSGGSVSLDDFMRALWRDFGKPDGPRPGYVGHPYSMADVEVTLTAVAGDRTFARDFLDRYVRGTELADYTRLLAPAGFNVRPAARGRLEIVPAESAGLSLTASQRAFRAGWLDAK